MKGTTTLILHGLGTVKDYLRATDTGNAILRGFSACQMQGACMRQKASRTQQQEDGAHSALEPFVRIHEAAELLHLRAGHAVDDGGPDAARGTVSALEQLRARQQLARFALDQVHEHAGCHTDILRGFSSHRYVEIGPLHRATDLSLIHI